MDALKITWQMKARKGDMPLQKLIHILHSFKGDRCHYHENSPSKDNTLNALVKH